MAWQSYLVFPDLKWIQHAHRKNWCRKWADRLSWSVLRITYYIILPEAPLWSCISRFQRLHSMHVRNAFDNMHERHLLSLKTVFSRIWLGTLGMIVEIFWAINHSSKQKGITGNNNPNMFQGLSSTNSVNPLWWPSPSWSRNVNDPRALRQKQALLISSGSSYQLIELYSVQYGIKTLHINSNYKDGLLWIIHTL